MLVESWAVLFLSVSSTAAAAATKGACGSWKAQPALQFRYQCCELPLVTNLQEETSLSISMVPIKLSSPAPFLFTCTKQNHTTSQDEAAFSGVLP